MGLGLFGSQSVRVFDPTADARKALSGAERHFGAQEWSLLVGGWERGATPSNPPPNTPHTQQIWGGFSAKWGKFLTFSPTPPQPSDTEVGAAAPIAGCSFTLRVQPPPPFPLCHGMLPLLGGDGNTEERTRCAHPTATSASVLWVKAKGLRWDSKQWNGVEGS